MLRQRAKVEVVADPRIDARRPRREAIVELTLADGTQLTEWVRDVRGTAENPMTRDEVVDKARDLIAPVLGTATCSALIDKLLSLETLREYPRAPACSSKELIQAMVASTATAPVTTPPSLQKALLHGPFVPGAARRRHCHCSRLCQPRYVPSP